MQIMGVLLLIAVILGVILLCREVSCWYFKINKSIELQEEANTTLRKILMNMPSQPVIEKAIEKEKGI